MKDDRDIRNRPYIFESWYLTEVTKQILSEGEAVP
jgi:hypothetical protein